MAGDAVTKVFRTRVSRELSVSKKAAIACRRKANSGHEAFATYAANVIRLNAQVAVLSEVLSAINDGRATTSSVRDFALDRVLLLARGRNPDLNALSAWARVVELTKPGS